MAILAAKKSATAAFRPGLGLPYEWTLAEAAGMTLGVDDVATPRTIRFIDCNAYCAERILRIWQGADVGTLASLPYATISYVWEGNHKPPVSSSLAVEGAEDGDRLSLEVLHTVCSVALRRGIPYIWIDRLCIMQKLEDDKHWQIRNMATIYRSCRICMVLPGGVGGFVCVSERTSWIERSWTLQETLLPEKVICIVTWELGRGFLGNSIASIEVVPENGVLVLPFLNALMLGTRPHFSSTRLDRNNDQIDLEWSFLACHQSQLLELEVAFYGEGNERESAIWRSALMRTSTRDVDVIYSIMGLFGVQLDPALYTGRTEATIALLRAITARGGKATWFGASLSLPMSSVRRTMPSIPESTNQDEPSILLLDGSLTDVRSVVTGACWYLHNPPTVAVDSFGFILFAAPMALVSFEPPTADSDMQSITASGRHGQAWSSGKPGSHAVIIGTTELYSSASVARMIWEETILLLLIEPHKDGGGWCKTGMAMVSPQLVEGWTKQEIRVSSQSCMEFLTV